MLYVMVLDSVYDKDDREALMAELDWPEVTAERSTIEQDRQARAAFAALGITPVQTTPPTPMPPDA